MVYGVPGKVVSIELPPGQVLHVVVYFPLLCVFDKNTEKIQVLRTIALQMWLAQPKV
jgi:hypothetical protein